MVSHWKRQEADDMLQKLSRMQATQMVSRFSQVNLHKPNPVYAGAETNRHWPLSEFKWRMFMSFKQNRTISKLNKKPMIVDQSTYIGNNISSTERGINLYISKVWTAIDTL